jgi:hypothetical protein
LEGEELISLKEAAARSGLSPSRLRWLAEHGRLKARKMGRDWFTTAADLAEYADDPVKRSRDPYKNTRGKQSER